MENKLIKQMILEYNPINKQDYINSLREALQRIILIGIARTNFFNHASMYGGTCLRIFHNINRFSEDLDFTKTDEQKINYEDILKFGLNELKSCGLAATLELNQKNVNTTVISGYYKINLWEFFSNNFNELKLPINKNELLSIKIDVEEDYYKSGISEYALIKFPVLSKIKIYNMESLFTGKLSAILFRNWGSRVKGRDYFDYLFYIKNNVKINRPMLSEVLIKKKVINSELELTIELVKDLLINQFNKVDIDQIKKDCLTFVKDYYDLDELDLDIFKLSVNEIEFK